MTINKNGSNRQQNRDPDLANAEIALRRSAIKARELAQKTNTSVVISKNGKIMEEQPDHVHTDH